MHDMCPSRWKNIWERKCRVSRGPRCSMNFRIKCLYSLKLSRSCFVNGTNCAYRGHKTSFTISVDIDKRRCFLCVYEISHFYKFIIQLNTYTESFSILWNLASRFVSLIVYLSKRLIGYRPTAVDTLSDINLRPYNRSFVLSLRIKLIAILIINSYGFLWTL